MPNPDKVRELYRECLPFYQRLKDQRQKNWDNFFGVWSGKTRSQIYVPLTFSKIQSMVAKVCMSFFNYPDFISVNPVSEEDIMGAKSMQKLLDVQTKSEQFLLNFVMWISYTLINSLSFIKVYWHKEQKPYMKKIPITNKAGIVTGYKKEIVKDWAIQEPRFSVCNMDNLFFHPQSNYLFPEQGKFIIDQYLRPVSEVRKMMDKGEWNGVGEEELKESSRTLAEDWTKEYRWDDYHPNPFKREYEIPDDPLVLITEYHEDSQYQIYANFKHTLKKEERPEYMQYKPYLSLKDYYIPHSVVGLGEAEILEDTQEYLNTIRNMRIDNWNLSIN